MRLDITVTATDAMNFLVEFKGRLANPRGLNEALGTRLAHELQAHFTARNKEPNKMGAQKTNFWQDVAEATKLEAVTDHEAVVAIAEERFRVHLYSGKIKPTGGRKWLTIPLVREARGKRVREYEKASGKKLFRLPGSKVLVERTAAGDRSLAFTGKGTVRNRAGGYRKINIGAGTRLRPVFALVKEANIKKDPRALPPAASLAAALQEEADAYIEITSRQS